MDTEDRVSIMQAAGVKRATRADFGPNASAAARYIDGVQVSPEEFRAHREEQKRLHREQRTELVEEEWSAEMDNRNILFAPGAEMPKNRTTKTKMVCGCEKKKVFEGHVHTLARLDRDRTCCPRCWEASKPDQLQALVKARGGKLLSPYAGAHTHVSIACARGHHFKATPANLGTVEKKGSWCPHCVRGIGEQKLSEVMAERGLMLLDYGLVNTQQDKIIAGFEGESLKWYHSQLMAVPPTYPTKRGPREVRTFYDEARKLAYVLVDRVPPKLPKEIAEIVNLWDYESWGEHRSKDAAYAVLKEAIAADNDPATSDFKVVNVLHNPKWVAPGEYKWGKFPAFDGTLVEMERAGA